MKPAQLHFILAFIVLGCLCFATFNWVGRASKSFETASKKGGLEPKAAVATAADEGYCSQGLKTILRRVLTSCGLVKGGKPARGCQPLEAKNVASMSGADFNALFAPLAHRASIIQFDQGKAILDETAQTLLEQTFTDQRGASYFLVVSRSSPEGGVERNRELSEQRAGAVLDHLKQRFNDPDLNQEVGLLWLGEEFAQLDQEFCKWNRSRGESECNGSQLNRSAFIAWIDCTL